MRTVSRIVLASLLCLGCVGCDQATKLVVRQNVVLGESHSFLGDTFRLMHAENPGAFLSLGEFLPDDIRASIFIVGVGLACLGAWLAAAFSPGLGRGQVVALSLIAGGGFGNWIDRLTNDGRVTDFLNVGVGSVRTGIFNVADVVLMAGLAIFLLSARRDVSQNDSRFQRDS